MGELDDKVVFTKTSVNSRREINQLQVIQDIVKLKIRQTGTITVEFNGEIEEISKIKDFFENVTDMEPITMNIASSGDIKSYFKGASPFKEEISPEGETYYTFGVTIQEIT